MPGEMKLIAVKVTATMNKAIEQLVAGGYYKTKSAFLDEAIMDKLRAHNLTLDALAEIRIERVGHPRRRRKKPGDSLHTEGESGT